MVLASLSRWRAAHKAEKTGSSESGSGGASSNFELVATSTRHHTSKRSSAVFSDNVITHSQCAGLLSVFG